MIETLGQLVLERGGYWMGRPAESRSNTLANPDRWLVEAFGGQPTGSGERVSPANATQFGAVQAAHRLLSEVEASLPCHLYRRRRNTAGSFTSGKDRATDSYLYGMLHDSPNGEQTSFEFWQAMRQNRAAWGNAYALPKYSGTGRWTEIYPLRPDWMTVYRNANGIKVYDYRPEWGPNGGKYLASEIIHVRGMGDDLVGWSPIKLEREGLGIGMAAQRAHGAFYRNGVHLTGILEVQGKIRDKDEEGEKFSRAHSGAANAGKVLVIDQGSKFISTTIPPEDAQYLATIGATRQEVFMIYGIPPHLMGDTEKSTSWGTGIEQQVIGFQKFTLRPSLEMTQQAFELKLLGAGNRELFIEFDLDGFLQADAKTRAEVLAVKRQNGVINADEWRALDNQNPIGGEVGETYLVNGTMIPITAALKKDSGQAAAA